jgi:2-polyprenyl-3-methyl-5-hydroxy-6-metoxy-1,4-benzoquinol methylase
MKPKSPLTNNNNVELIRKISTKFISDSFKNNFKIEVDSYFTELENLELYRCLETGIKFFHPIDRMGDGNFYQDLQKNDWYYMDWKWEHEKTMDLLSKDDSILEIGSGDGNFVKTLYEKGFQITGLELNSSTVEKANRSGYKILNQTIQDHAKKNLNTYDVVCSFQVMEHIPNILEVLKASIDSMKVGGKLFIGVPNDDSFLGKDEMNILNMPPHHCTLWNKQCLQKLANILGIKLTSIYLEPLQDYHVDYYHFIQKQVYSKVPQRMYDFYKQRLFPYLRNNTYLVPGFSILAEYEKI